MPKLHFPQPEFTTHSCDLPEGVTKVGRSSRNNLVLSDASVSADHCEVLVSWNEVIVRDLGSSNGTWVAGVRVDAASQLPVNHGAVIRFGRVEARLELDGFPSDDATSVTANFGASRAAECRPNPEPFKRVIATDSSGHDTRNPTSLNTAPVHPSPPATIAEPQSLLAKPEPNDRRHGWWWKAALLMSVILAVAGLLWASR